MSKIIAGLAMIFVSCSASSALAKDDVSTIASLQKRVDALETRYRHLEDKAEIERLQRIYGYYVERGMLDEVADLFSTSSQVEFEMGGRVMMGRAAIRKFFNSATPFGVMTPGAKPKDYLHVTAPIAGVVDVGEDGRTAKGRWYALMFLNNAGMGGGAVQGLGIYENDYVKEDGKWKISRLNFDDLFLSAYDEKGWINSMPAFASGSGAMLGRGRSRETPFGDLMPFHYHHPIIEK